jgi:hypothetical protein
MAALRGKSVFQPVVQAAADCTTHLRAGLPYMLHRNHEAEVLAERMLTCAPLLISGNAQSARYQRRA